jgi:hypothetical protein
MQAPGPKHCIVAPGKQSRRATDDEEPEQATAAKSNPPIDETNVFDMT